jgi:hypothetical protein
MAIYHIVSAIEASKTQEGEEDKHWEWWLYYTAEPQE